MLNRDDFQYALENTEVLRQPEARISTFGTTSFRFFLISELMDRVDQVRVRDGRMHAERPEIITPGHYSRMLLEGFGEKARGFAEWLEANGGQLAILKYGFRFRKGEITEDVVHQPAQQVIDQVQRKAEALDDPLSVVIRGVDDAWEVCLLKFTIDMIQRSAGGNFGDLKHRGLL